MSIGDKNHVKVRMQKKKLKDLKKWIETINYNKLSITNKMVEKLLALINTWA